MNTYHIDPSSSLAAEAAEEVRAFSANTLIAVRGQDFDYGDGDVAETVYTVSACPNQDDTSGYCWTYVLAGDWIAEFDAIQQEETKTMRFVAGCRMVGYRPDSETYLFGTSEEAMACVRDMMREAADAEDRWSDEDIAAIDTIAADPRGEFGVTVYGWHYFVAIA